MIIDLFSKKPINRINSIKPGLSEYVSWYDTAFNALIFGKDPVHFDIFFVTDDALPSKPFNATMVCKKLKCVFFANLSF